MSHRDYVADRIAREPHFKRERAAASAELEFATMVGDERRARGLTIQELATNTGIPEDRLSAIEEGDGVTLYEILWLIDALELSINAGADFRVFVSASARPTVRFSRGAVPVLTGGSRPESSPGLGVPSTTASSPLIASCAATG